MIGYLLRRVEVERLVHHAVQIGDAIVGLHRERLRELEAGLGQRRQVRRFELQHADAERVVERRLRRAVDARGVVDEEPRRFGDRHAVRGVARVEQLEAGAVEADAIEVRVVRVLALLAAAGREVEHARLVVDALDGGGDELAFGDAVLQRAGRRVVEIEVSPAVALGPEDQLGAAVDQAQRLRFDVGVQPLFDQRLDLAGRGVGDDDVEPVLVAAEAREIQLVGRVAEPLRRDRPPRIALDVVALRRRWRSDTRLIGEAIVLDRDALLRVAVEHVHLRLRDVRLARHRVAIGLERRPRRAPAH